MVKPSSAIVSISIPSIPKQHSCFFYPGFSFERKGLLPYNRGMPYVQPRGKKRKIKIFRLVLLILIVLALGFGSVWTYLTFFKHDPVIVVKDPVETQMKGTYTRNLVLITNPFEYVNNRLESVEINGQTIDLVALYTKYEPYQYYLAEPIDEAELNAQFLEIYLFLKPIYQEMLNRDYTTEKRIDMFGNEYESDEAYYAVSGAFVQGLMSFADQMNASTDPTFTRYKTSFVYDDIRNYVMYKEPKHVFMMMQGKEAFITRYDRQVFVRMFKIMAVMVQEQYAKNGITYTCTLCPVPKDKK